MDQMKAARDSVANPGEDGSSVRNVWTTRPATGSSVTAAATCAIDRRELPTMQLETPGGTIVVEIADTPAARSAGLSNREGLDGVAGLLLKWDMPGRHPIWVAEMQFALDLAWLDPNGRVVAVLANVPPCRANPCELYEPDGNESLCRCP
jgi:hypothetical protein